MRVRLTLLVLVAFVVAACTKTAVLKETEPLRVTASPPAPPPPPPPPPPPKRVEVKKEKIQVNEKIHFDFNKATIKPDSYNLLDEIADVILKHPELKKISIEGHTDSIGTPKYNLKLSKERATAVRDYLVNKGVEPDRLVTEGFGLERPIADNETEEGRAQNRRVEFNIIERAEETATTPEEPAAAAPEQPAAATPEQPAATTPEQPAAADDDDDGSAATPAPAEKEATP